MIEKRVKIVKDTVSHRLPIGSIQKIRESDKTVKGKKCYNVQDYCCYVSEDDIEILSESMNSSDIIERYDVDVSNSFKDVDDSPSWFNSYTDFVTKNDPPLKKGDKVYAKNVKALTPNGVQMKAKDGVFILYEEQKRNDIYWLRREDNSDLNEYFCKCSDVGILSPYKSSSQPKKKENKKFKFMESYARNHRTMEDHIDEELFS